MGTLQELAIQIRDEQRNGANSSTRVGGLLLEMAKLLESSESNNIYISDLSELDNYKMTTHKGAFNVYLRGNLFVGVLFIIQYQAPHHGGLQVFLSTFDYKMSGSSSLSMPSIIYRSTDYNNNQKWLEWKPYQNTFISDDGTVPTSGGLGFDNTNFAPSLRLFLEYPKIIEWSGELLETNITFESESVVDVVPSEIYYYVIDKIFCVKRNNKYYNSWINKDDSSGLNGKDYFVKNNSFTKNIFKGLDGSTWIATASDEIVHIVGDYPKIISWSGEIVEDANILPMSTVKPGIVVFVTNKNTFAYRTGSTYCSNWPNRSDFQANIYLGTGFTAKFTKNLFKGSDGSIWIADSASSIKMIGKDEVSADAPKDGKQYVRKDGKWTPFVSVNNGDIVLPDKSTMTLESYKTSGRSDAIGVVFDKYKGLFVKKDYYSGTLIANQSVALEIFYAKVKCHAPYDGRTTQKLNLLHSSNPATEFPVFNYAEQNGVYVASNGEIEQIKEVNESLQAIKSNIVSFSYIASCTQRPKATSSASVFYGGAWGASDYRDPSTALNYLLIDIL